MASLDFKTSPVNSEMSTADNSYRESCLSLKDGIKQQKKPPRIRNNPTGVRKTKINSQRYKDVQPEL